jgi:MFS family permease
MEDAFKLETNFKYTPHIILFTILFTFQYFTKASEVRANLDATQKQLGDKIFWKFILSYQFAKAADWCLGPYVFEFFEKYHHLSMDWVAKMMAISFLSSLILGTLLVGYINDKSDKKFPCVLFGILTIISCCLRMIKNPLALIMSQIFFGMSNSILYSSFENWFVTEINDKIKDPIVKDVVISSTFEKAMIFDSITAVAVSFLVGVIRREMGIIFPYYICIIFSICSLVLSVINLESIELKEEKMPEHEVIDVFKNSYEALKELYQKPFLILIGITEALLFGVLHIFIFVWNPTLKELKPDYDPSEVFTIFMIALMVGGSSFRVNFFNFRQYT